MEGPKHKKKIMMNWKRDLLEGIYMYRYRHIGEVPSLQAYTKNSAILLL